MFRYWGNSRYVASITATLVAIVLFGSNAQGAIVFFDLQGKAGRGLLSGNENQAVNGVPGTGGIIGGGIFLDDVTRVLTLNVGWGTGNGFTNLTGNATATHIHGPTALPATPPDFTVNFGVRHGLDANPSPNVTGVWTPSATNGSFIGTVALDATQQSILLAGHYYFNVHTGTNGAGEIRGNLIAVPEPSSMMLLGCAAAYGIISTRRRRR